MNLNKGKSEWGRKKDTDMRLYIRNGYYHVDECLGGGRFESEILGDKKR